MKTVVLGVFDELEDARRVLVQLTSSPLDLSAVAVVHRQAEVQHSLWAEAGLPPKRSVPSGIAAGALLGAVLGAFAGMETPLFSSLGPMLTAAAGLLLGALGGGLAATLADQIPLPPGQDTALIAAIEDGATGIVVQTDNPPTARAILDLFRAAGSRVLEEPDSRQPPADSPASLGPQSQGKSADLSPFAPPSRGRGS